MIIIEGPDNSGKSTLAERLSQELKIPVIHSQRPSGSPSEILEHSFKQLQPQMAILDRVYAMSEYVYGPICRGATDLGDLHHKALIDLYNRPYLIIYCRPPMETILKNDGRDQMEGVLDNHQAIVERYDELMMEVSRFTTGKVIQYDWTKVGIMTVVGYAKKHHKEMHSQAVSSLYMTMFKEDNHE